MAITQFIRTRQRALLALVAVAVEKELPLAPTIEAYAAEEGGWFGRRAFDFAVLLGEGVPLVEAMDLMPGVLPRSEKLVVQVGQHLGALGPALRDAIEQQSAQQPLWQAVGGRILYAIAVLCMLTFTLIQLVPRATTILQDIGVTLAPPILLPIEWFNAFTNSSWRLVVIVLLVAVFLYAVLAYIGWVVPHRGLLGRWLVQLDRAKILRALSLTVERGRSLEETLAVLDKSYPKRWIRKKLKRAAKYMAGGLRWPEALRREGLVGKTDVALLDAAERAGNLAWGLNETAAGNERRLYYRLEGTVQILFPISILLIGVAVLLVALAIFVPMITLLHESI